MTGVSTYNGSHRGSHVEVDMEFSDTLLWVTIAAEVLKRTSRPPPSPRVVDQEGERHSGVGSSVQGFEQGVCIYEDGNLSNPADGIHTDGVVRERSKVGRRVEGPTGGRWGGRRSGRGGRSTGDVAHERVTVRGRGNKREKGATSACSTMP